MLNEEKEAGYHSVYFDASDLPSGVYFVSIKVRRLHRYKEDDTIKVRIIKYLEYLIKFIKLENLRTIII